MTETLPISRKLRRGIENLGFELYYLPRRSEERSGKYPQLEKVRYVLPGELMRVRDHAECVVALINRQLGDRPTQPPAWKLVRTDDPTEEAKHADSARGKSSGAPTGAGSHPLRRRRP